MPQRTPAVIALLVALSITGCLGPPDAPLPDDPPGVEHPLCPAPCELPVDTGPDRAFQPTAALDPEDRARAVIVSTVFRDDGCFYIDSIRFGPIASLEAGTRFLLNGIRGKAGEPPNVYIRGKEGS